MFTSRVTVVRMSKMTQFLFFLLMTAKNQSIWAKYLKAPERSYLLLPESVMNYWVMVISKMSILENTRFWYFFVESAGVFLYFYIRYPKGGNFKAY